MKIIYVSHSKKFDFKKLLYESLKNSSLNSKVRFVFPHENSDEYYNTKDLFNSGKEIIVLPELSFPSTGRDIEIGMAFQKNIPVIGIYKRGAKISGSQKFVCKILIEYDYIEDAIAEVENYLEQQIL